MIAKPYISGFVVGDIIASQLHSAGFKRYNDNYSKVFDYVRENVSFRGSNGKEGRAKRYYYSRKEVIKLIENYISENKDNLIKEDK